MPRHSSDNSRHDSTVETPIAAALERSPDVGAAVSVCVAFSGGRDSAVLLRATHAIGATWPEFRVRAIHVDHQLHPDSAKWAEHARSFCETIGVPIGIHAVLVDAAGGQGPEAAARRARYALFERELADGELLLTAHHQQDQLETVLLQLMRGAGVAGLAGMPADKAFGRGRLLRPLLSVDPASIRSYAERHALAWVDDPSNDDPRFDRNFLRRDLLPALLERWPQAAETIGRSARLCAEATGLLEDLAAHDAAGAACGQRLRLDALRRLAPSRQANLVRYMLTRNDCSMPSERRLKNALGLLCESGPAHDVTAELPGVKLRCYRGEVHFLVDPGPDDDARWRGRRQWMPDEPLSMGPLRGRLSVGESVGAGIARRFADAPLSIGFREGGEEFRPVGSAHRRKLKKLFQDAGILPWMRDYVPIIYAGDELVAVADLWSAADAAAAPGEAGLEIVWDLHPPVS